jgi:hypothetical protein
MVPARQLLVAGAPDLVLPEMVVRTSFRMRREGSYSTARAPHRRAGFAQEIGVLEAVAGWVTLWRLQ